MLDLSAIYRNPVIEEGFYYVKVIDVQTEPYPNCVMPLIQVRLQPHPEDGFDKNLMLSAIVYPTTKAKYHMKNFLNTFLENGDGKVEVKKVLHRWGCVRVYPNQYGETQYSAVKWIYQLPPVKQNIARLYEEERKRQPH